MGGGTPKTSCAEYWNGDIPWLSVKDFNNDNRYVYSTEKTITQSGLEHSSTKLLQKDDIIISARGTVGEMAMIPFPMAFNQSCYGIRGKEYVDKSFLYYLLKNSIYKLKALTHGSVFDTITKNTFAEIDINLPDLETQKKTGYLLGLLDNKIELNNRINKNLEEQAQAIFKSWFVDFEPFGGTMPENWKKSNLLDIADYLNGLAMQKFRPLKNEESLPVLKIKELRQGVYDSDSELCSANIKSEYIVYNGDVIFSWSGSLLVDFWCGGTCGLNHIYLK
ncbi:MAG: restriction endonuclease subunit S [Muribaculaceae bacterium]|nr:restriction endonuclease subunit S [Muribaculaceae bacterium]